MASAVSQPAPPRAGEGPLCAGRPATIVGTQGDDLIIGTRGDDVIHGLGGNDLTRDARGTMSSAAARVMMG